MNAQNLPTTIPEYLEQLRAALRGADPAMIQDAVYDAEEYLRSELAEQSGKSEAEVIASVAGAFGWRTIEVRAQRPERVFRWLVPATLLLSLVPDVILGTSGAWEWSVVLAAIAMHVATIAIAVAVYVWQMPVRRDQL